MDSTLLQKYRALAVPLDDVYSSDEILAGSVVRSASVKRPLSVYEPRTFTAWVSVLFDAGVYDSIPWTTVLSSLCFHSASTSPPTAAVAINLASPSKSGTNAPYAPNSTSSAGRLNYAVLCELLPAASLRSKVLSATIEHCMGRIDEVCKSRIGGEWYYMEFALECAFALALDQSCPVAKPSLHRVLIPLLRQTALARLPCLAAWPMGESDPTAAAVESRKVDWLKSLSHDLPDGGRWLDGAVARMSTLLVSKGSSAPEQSSVSELRQVRDQLLALFEPLNEETAAAVAAQRGIELSSIRFSALHECRRLANACKSINASIATPSCDDYTLILRSYESLRASSATNPATTMTTSSVLESAPKIVANLASALAAAVETKSTDATESDHQNKRSRTRSQANSPAQESAKSSGTVSLAALLDSSAVSTTTTAGKTPGMPVSAPAFQSIKPVAAAMTQVKVPAASTAPTAPTAQTVQTAQKPVEKPAAQPTVVASKPTSMVSSEITSWYLNASKTTIEKFAESNLKLLKVKIGASDQMVEPHYALPSLMPMLDECTSSADKQLVRQYCDQMKPNSSVTGDSALNEVARVRSLLQAALSKKQ